MATGFGRSVYCLDSRQTGRFADGITALAQSCYRRLTTTRGTLGGAFPSDDAANYGLNLSDYLGGVGASVAIEALPALIKAELQKDERVGEVAVTMAQEIVEAAVKLVITISVISADSLESFALTLAVDDVTTALLKVSA